MNALSNVLHRSLSPVFRPLSRRLLAPGRRHPTWAYEFAAVGIALAAVTSLTTDWGSARSATIALAGAAGVFFSFGHANVTSRMTEKQAAQAAPDVACWRMADRYWIAKEIAWFAAFVASGLYAALVGSVIFLLYPVWRRVHVETRRQVRPEPAPPDSTAEPAPPDPRLVELEECFDCRSYRNVLGKPPKDVSVLCLRHRAPARPA